ncbi:MAG: hypothetical protein KY391_02360 [Actinobacteria bacterium]|nr:hypothetical protein [Actinomycetota bacterium]
MADRDAARHRAGGAAGPGLNVRKGIQGALLVATLLMVFVVRTGIDSRAVIFGAMVLVVVIDLVMLVRGDLVYTHFQSREWSFRMNAILLSVALVLFAVTVLDI